MGVNLEEDLTKELNVKWAEKVEAQLREAWLMECFHHCTKLCKIIEILTGNQENKLQFRMQDSLGTM